MPSSRMNTVSREWAGSMAKSMHGGSSGSGGQCDSSATTVSNGSLISSGIASTGTVMDAAPAGTPRENGSAL